MDNLDPIQPHEEHHEQERFQRPPLEVHPSMPPIQYMDGGRFSLAALVAFLGPIGSKALVGLSAAAIVGALVLHFHHRKPVVHALPAAKVTHLKGKAHPAAHKKAAKTAPQKSSKKKAKKTSAKKSSTSQKKHSSPWFSGSSRETNG